MQTWLRAICLPLVLAVSACGGGGGGGSGTTNTAPTANFAFSCVDLTCDFVNASTTQDTNDTLIAYTWTFGDNSATVGTVNASHTYPAASTYTVSLLVIDSKGARSTATRQVTVTAPAAGSPAPHANFDVGCVAFDCTFTDTSTYDPGSAFQSRLWDFGDGTTLAATNPVTHTYPTQAQPTGYTARLTVTDAAGKTSTITRSVVVSPPVSSSGCVSGNCSLILTQASKVSVSLVAHSCSARSNTVKVVAPVTQTVFSNGCVDPLNQPVLIGGGATYPAGTAVQLTILSGTLPNSQVVFAPAIRVSGDATQGWTLTFDDGFGGAGEPDFDDLVILVKPSP